MQAMEQAKSEIVEIYGANPAQSAEWNTLERLMKSHGTVIPFPHLAMAKVSYDKGRIIGYAIFQMVPHTEPLWVDPQYRGGTLTHDLAASVSNFARDTGGQFVCIATSGFVEDLCREQNMNAIAGTLFVGKA